MDDAHLIIGDRASYLRWVIEEFNKLEKYFGIDKKGNILYDEERDQKLVLKHMKSSHQYIGYEGFVDLIDGKSKKDYERELESVINPKSKINLIQPSEEQSLIVKNVKGGKNVVVEAVAGSGKTTTVMFIAEAMEKSKIMQITYNKQLKFEVREKVVARKIKNLTINTYHSLAVKFYDENAHDDLKLKQIFINDVKPRYVDQINVLIIDEKQDMTPDYYHFIHKFIRDMNFCGSIVLLGDRYQGVYEFKNADSRFLTLGSQLYGKNNFVSLSLQESFRVTSQMAWFVNNVMLGHNRIISNKKGKHPVYYYKRNIFSCHLEFARILTEFMTKGYKADDIFVLAPSLKNSSPVKKLENVLVEQGVPIYFSRNEDDGMDEEVIKGKIVFTTFHQAKGRERKICLIYGFDESYFNFHAKEKDRDTCPSELYVATTRASEILLILENDKENPLTFLKHTHNEMLTLSHIRANVKFTGNVRQNDIKTGGKKQSSTEHNITVKELVSYLGQENLGRLNVLVKSISKVTQKPRIETTVDIPLTMESDKGFTELVGDLNGIVIPAYYESRTTKISALENNLKYLYNTSDDDTRNFIDKYLREIKPNLKDEYSHFLCNGNIYVSLDQKLRSNLKQVDKYNWLTKPIVNTCCKNLATNIGENPTYERHIGNCGVEQEKFFRYKSTSYGYINVRNIVDCYDDTILWEFKCVTSITIEHILQLIVYAWIWQSCMAEKHGDRDFNILNIRTGEKINVKYETETIDDIMEVLFENKFGTKPKISNAEFILKCDTIYNKVQNNINEIVDEMTEDSISMFVKPKKAKQILIKQSNDSEEEQIENDTNINVNDITKFLTNTSSINVKKVKASDSKKEETETIFNVKKVKTSDSKKEEIETIFNVKKVKAIEQIETIPKKKVQTSTNVPNESMFAKKIPKSSVEIVPKKETETIPKKKVKVTVKNIT